MASIIATFGEANDRCSACDTRTIVVTALCWKTRPENDGEEFVEPRGESSGHYCPNCNVLTAVFIHTPNMPVAEKKAP